jgi:ABC-type branched-subunit amino acid transport system permease subunit
LGGEIYFWSPEVKAMEFWIVQTLNALSFSMLLFLLCAGLSLIFGLMNILNLAHGSSYLVGAYVGLSVINATHNYFIGLLGGVVAAGSVGYLMQNFLLQRIYGKRLSQVLLTFGCMFIIGDSAILIWGAHPYTLPKPRFLSTSFHLGDIVFPSYRLFVIAVGLAIGIMLWYFQEKTRWGATIRAGVDDEYMARAVGINVPLLFILAFILGTALTGISGVLGGPFVGVYPGVDLEVLLLAMVVIIIGGLGSMKGAFLGSLIVGFLDNFGKALFPKLAMFTIFVPMAIILALKPTRFKTYRSMGKALSEKSQSITLIGAFVLILGLIPLILPQYYVSLITRALILAILAMSVNLLLGYLGLASVGHAVFFGISAYTLAIVTRHMAGAVWPAIGMALLAAVLAGALFGLLALRTRDIFFLVIMLAFSQITYAIAISWQSLTGGDDGLPGLLRPELFPNLSLKPFMHFYIFVVIIFLLIMIGFWLLVSSPFGLTLKGIRDSEDRMKILGYNVWLYKYLAFIISALIGGISGILFAYYYGCPTPKDVGLIRSSTALIMVILGGSGTLVGPVIGAILIVFLEELFSLITERWLLVLGLVYVIVVLLSPEGLLGALIKRAKTTPELENA